MHVLVEAVCFNHFYLATNYLVFHGVHMNEDQLFFILVLMSA